MIQPMAALGVPPPAYAHLPMILGADGAKLSKRHGAVDVRDYREQGYLPEALINYLVRLGWSYGDQEIFSMEEMIALFDIAAVNQSASAFNPEKLKWLNQQYIIAMSPEELGERLLPYLEAAGIDVSTVPPPAAVAAAFHGAKRCRIYLFPLGVFPFIAWHDALHKFVEQRNRECRIAMIWAPNHAILNQIISCWRDTSNISSEPIRYIAGPVRPGTRRIWV